METNKPNNPKEKTEKSPDEFIRESEITKEDLEALGRRDDNLRSDGGDDEQLLEREREVDFAGEGLDVPGSELDDEEEKIGSEDEENNFYSNSDEERD